MAIARGADRVLPKAAARGIFADIDLAHLASIVGGQPVTPDEVVEARGFTPISHVGILLTWDWAKVGTGPLKAIGFVEYNPRPGAIESKTGLRPSRDFDGQAFIDWRRVRHRENGHDLLVFLGYSCEQNGTRTVLAAFLPSSLGLITSIE